MSHGEKWYRWLITALRRKQISTFLKSDFNEWCNFHSITLTEVCVHLLLRFKTFVWAFVSDVFRFRFTSLPLSGSTLFAMDVRGSRKYCLKSKQSHLLSGIDCAVIFFHLTFIGNKWTSLSLVCLLWATCKRAGIYLVSLDIGSNNGGSQSGAYRDRMSKRVESRSRIKETNRKFAINFFSWTKTKRTELRNSNSKLLDPEKVTGDNEIHQSATWSYASPNLTNDG